jgi:hypothetical protein
MSQLSRILPQYSIAQAGGLMSPRASNNSSAAQEAAHLLAARGQQLSNVETAIRHYEAQQRQLTSQREQLRLLQSVAQGLYEELDKLCKKSPAEQITDLALEQVNTVIEETKDLLINDSYIKRLKKFVAAGDNPEHRDVVVVLRQILQGLKRFEDYSNPLTGAIGTRLTELKALRFALQSILGGEESLSRKDFNLAHHSISDSWYDDRFDLVNPQFRIELLDRINVFETYEVPEEQQ